MGPTLYATLLAHMKTPQTQQAQSGPAMRWIALWNFVSSLQPRGETMVHLMQTILSHSDVIQF